jgi:23S rRNA-/tRNA-specific pseudouridylate synthase
VEKFYWAVVRGAPPRAEGETSAPLLKRSTARDGWCMAVDRSGASRR